MAVVEDHVRVDIVLVDDPRPAADAGEPLPRPCLRAKFLLPVRTVTSPGPFWPIWPSAHPAQPGLPTRAPASTKTSMTPSSRAACHIRRAAGTILTTAPA